MPGPTGANPALTIAALSNRFADRIIERHRKKASPNGSAPRSPEAASNA
jgi:cholesterol oxidase